MAVTGPDTMLAKSLGLSQLMYTASMLSVTEAAIQQTQTQRNERSSLKEISLCDFYSTE